MSWTPRTASWRRLGRALSRRMSRGTVVPLSWLLLVAVGSTASAAALTSSSAASAQSAADTAGVSRTVSDPRSTAVVGALFRGKVSPGGHFCTASVVDSPGRDLIVTAAHCVSGGGANVSFVPGYHDGQAPYGVWKLTRVTLDPRWTHGRDPDADVAFATVAPLNGRQVENVVGADTLGTGHAATSTVRVTGYPDSAESPVTCVNQASALSATQLRIACTGYSGGTSGSPWVTGGHTVMGVIGGYETGGSTPDVSYSPYFGTAVAALYRRASAD